LSTPSLIKRLFFLCISFILSYNLFGQNDEGFIHGKITTISGSTYQGQIRLGKEEAFWNDIFNSTKVSTTENTYSKYSQDKKNKDYWKNIDGKI